MEIESKLEVKEEPECPEVDGDSKADGTTETSTLVTDLELSNDSPTESERPGGVGNGSGENSPQPTPEHRASPQATIDAAVAEAIHPGTSREDILNEQLNEVAASPINPQDPEMCVEVSAQSVEGNAEKIQHVLNEADALPQTSGAEAIHTGTWGKISTEQQTFSGVAAPSEVSQDPEMLTEESSVSVVESNEKITIFNESCAPHQTNEEAAGAEVIYPETKAVIWNEQAPNEIAASRINPQEPEICVEKSTQSVEDNAEKIQHVLNEADALPQTSAAEAIHSETWEQISTEQQTLSGVAAPSEVLQDPEMFTEESSVSLMETTENVTIFNESCVPPQTTEEAADAQVIYPETKEVILNEQAPNEVEASPKDSQDPERRALESADSLVDHIERMPVLSESGADPQCPIDNLPLCVNYPNDTSQSEGGSKHVAPSQDTEQLCTPGTVSLLSADEAHLNEAMDVDIDDSELKTPGDPNPPTQMKANLSSQGTTRKHGEMRSDDVESISKEHPPGGNEQSGTLDPGSLGIDKKTRRVRFNGQESTPASGISSDQADSTPEIAKLSVKELIKYYKWFNQGISSEEALAKAKQRGIMPQSDNRPHPNCKLKWGEIKNISRVIKDEVQRTRYQVEVYFGGKDPEEQLQLVMSQLNVDRHPECQHSWKDLEAFSNASQEYLRLRYKVETFYEGKNTSNVESSYSPEGILSKDDLLPVSSSDQNSQGSIKEFAPASPEIAGLNLNQLKKYYQWVLLGSASDVALKNAKEPNLEPPFKGHLSGQQLSGAKARNITKLIPGDYAKLRFEIDVLYGGMNPIEQLKLMRAMSKIKRYRKCEHSWEELEEISKKLPDVYSRTKFLVNTFCNGKEPHKYLKDFQCCIRKEEVAINMQQKKDLIAKLEPNSEPASELSCKELRSYYKWRILGDSSDEALAKAKDPVLIPKTEDPHPNCKLRWNEVKQISSLIPESFPRLKFQIETFLGGKDPIKLLEIMLAVSKKERHPNCKHSWEELEEMSNNVTDATKRSEFLFDVYCSGREPHTYLKHLECGIRKEVVVTNMRQKKDLIAKLEPNSEPASKLGPNERRRYYKWRILGETADEALAKAKDPALGPMTNDPHPNCKFRWKEFLEVSSVLPLSSKMRAIFILETFHGGKDPIKVLEILLAISKKERQPYCKYSWEELEEMSNKVSQAADRLKFLIDVYFNRKEPEEMKEKMQLDLDLPKISSNSETDVAVTAQTKISAPENKDNPDPETRTEIAKLSLNQLKKYYKWRILGVSCGEAVVKAKEPGLIPQTDDPHPDCKFPWSEIKETALLIPAKHPRGKFLVEVFFGGKDPDDQLRLMMTESKAQRHPKCKHSWEELKQLCHELPKDSLKFKFLVDAFFGGKEPADLLKEMLPNAEVADEPQNLHAPNDSIDTAIEEGPIKDLFNWQLKNYYLWRNSGKDHTAALAKISEHVAGQHPPHPSCRSSESEVKQMALPLSANTVTANRFFIHVYFGGKDPACTLKCLQTRSGVSDTPVKPPAGDSIDTAIEEGPIKDLPNWQLKNYYMWRNTGKDHTAALAKISEHVAGQHPPHPSCRSSESEVKQMALPLSANTVTANRFFIHVYFGGKDPACTLKCLQTRSGVSDTPVKPPAGDSIDTAIEEGPIKDLPNWQLKNYYLWRNTGKDHTAALAKISIEVKVAGQHPPHPNCRSSESEVKQMALPLSANTVMANRFFIHVYFGGKDPACTLKCLQTRSGVSDTPVKPPAAEDSHGTPVKPPAAEDSIDTTIEDGLIKGLLNWQLKNYYLWRNSGKDHTAALARISENVAGQHPPHPNCRSSESEVKQMALPLSANTIMSCRFFIHVYFGGKDPACTLKYLQSCPGAYDPFEDPTVIDCSELENLSNGALGFYYQWRIKGCIHTKALSIVKKRVPFSGEFRRHRNCKLSKKGIEQMSRPLLPHPLRHQRFFIHVYYGGKDPQCAMRHFMTLAPKSEPEDVLAQDQSKMLDDCLELGLSRDEAIAKTEEPKKPNSAKPLPFQPVAKRTKSCPDGRIIPLDSPEHPINFLNDIQLRTFYLVIHKGESHERAVVRAKIPKLLKTPKGFRSRCLVSKSELKTMSNRLPAKLRPLFFTEAFYGGSDPEEVMEYLLRRESNKASNPCTERVPANGPHKSSGGLDDELVPLDSPEHPINILSGAKLMKFYLWTFKGLSREEALVKANSRDGNIVPPNDISSRCLVPKPQLVAMSLSLPENLRKLFISETFFGGSDPNKVKEYLLKKIKPHTKNLGDEIIPLNSPLHPINTLNLVELNNYYRWISKGVSHEHAFAKVKTPHIYVPVKPNFGPKCKTSKVELKAMSTRLPAELRTVFVAESLYGGHKPGEVMEYLIAKASTLLPVREKWPVQPQTNPAHNAGVPMCPPEAPVGMPQHQTHADWNAAGSSSMHHPQPQDPTYYQQPLDPIYQQPPINYVNFGPPAIPSFPVAPIPGNPQPVQHFNPDYPPPMTHGYPPGIPVPPPYQLPASGLHHADLPQVAAPPVFYPPDQSPFISQPPVLYPPQAPAPHPIPTPAVPQQPSASSPLLHQPAISPPGTSLESSPPTKTAKCVENDSKPVNELSRATLPIKINLKSTPQDLNKPAKSPQKQKTTKTLDEKKPAQNDGSVPMHIVPTGYPHERLTEEQMDAIEGNLLEAILEMDDDGLKPSFKDSSRSDGRCNITCIDEFSVNWLYKYVNTYQPWPGASLKLISGGPKKIKANAVLPPCRADDDQKILKFIEKQNKGLNVNLWTVVQRWNNGDFNTCMELVIDEESAEILQNCSRISFKLGSAEIVIAKNDDPVQSDVPMSAVAESSKTSSVSSRTYRRASPPPPPKRMLSGESIPTPPSKRSRSSHDSEEPHSNSARRAPSRDRFGRSTSRSPSPAEKHSWMDWFYAKEERSKASSPNSTHGEKHRRSGSRLSEDRRSGSPISPSQPSKYRKRRASRSHDRSASRSPTPDKRRKKRYQTHRRSYSRSPSPRRSSPRPSSRYHRY